MKEAYYFSHDSNAHKDPKILKLRAKYGWEGYGIYWALVEMLYQESTFSLNIGDNKICSELEKDQKETINLINHCIECELFNSDGKEFWLKNKKRKNKRFVRLYESDVKLWYQIRDEIFKRDNYTCSYCGKRGGNLEADHITPLSKGGTNDLGNLTTSCRRCNRQKKDKTVDEFMVWREKIGKTN